MNIKYLVMQSPKSERIENVSIMKRNIPELTVVEAAPPDLWEQFCDCFKLEEDYDGMVFLEDDIRLCKDFTRRVEVEIDKKPDDVISFFKLSGIKTKYEPVASYKPGSSFCSMCCNYIPKWLCELIYDEDNRAEFRKEYKKSWTYPSDDYVAWLLKKYGKKYYMVVPFLAQHLDMESNFKGRSTARQTPYFIDDYEASNREYQARSKKLIGIGYSQQEKEKAVREYLKENPEVKHIVYYVPAGLKRIDIDFPDVWNETFYSSITSNLGSRLWEVVDESFLFIYDECMRVKKRTDLTYNSFHLFQHHSEHAIVFETFPMIDDPDDFMILVDMAYPNMYIQSRVTPDVIELADIKPYEVKFEPVSIETTEEQKAAYEIETNRMFDELGNKDPNTIPRNLALWVGTTCKKNHIDSSKINIARNGRFKTKTYKDYSVYDNGTYASMPFSEHEKHSYTREFEPAEEVTIIDFPVKTRELMDLIKFSGAHTVKVMTTDLKIDAVMYEQHAAIFQKMKEVFYE